MAIIKAEDYINLQNKISREIANRFALSSSFSMREFQTEPSENGRIKKDYIDTIRHNLSWVDLSDEDKKKYKYALEGDNSDVIRSLKNIEELVDRLADYSYGCNASCTGYCSSSCTGFCENSCTGNCSNTCSGSCVSDCADDCVGGCTGSCTGGCYGTCIGDCTGGCDGTCIGGGTDNP